jgi:hypothetical protein
MVAQAENHACDSMHPLFLSDETDEPTKKRNDLLESIIKEETSVKMIKSRFKERAANAAAPAAPVSTAGLSQWFTCTKSAAVITSKEIRQKQQQLRHLQHQHRPDHSEMCECNHCKSSTRKDSDPAHTITPFELALVTLYAHHVDKAQKKSFNLLDESLERAQERFIAALEVVETMLTLDDERARRESKATHKKGVESKEVDGEDVKERNQIKAVKDARKHCKSAQNLHYKFYSGSNTRGLIFGALFCALVTFCAIWMAASPSAELAQWQNSISSAAFNSNIAQVSSSYGDTSAFLAALFQFSVAWPLDSSFTRSLGSTELRVVRLEAQPASRCVGSESLACVPTIGLFPSLSANLAMLPPAAYSQMPSSFSVPPYSSSFNYQDRKTPIRCGAVYCFDGSGYTFQAANSSEFLAALHSQIFDSSVRAVIISFALYSPSLQAVYKGSYLAEMLPTGSVLVSFDAFVFDYVDAVGLDRTVLDWNKLTWAMKIVVSAVSLCCVRSSDACACRSWYAHSSTS